MNDRSGNNLIMTISIALNVVLIVILILLINENQKLETKLELAQYRDYYTQQGYADIGGAQQPESDTFAFGPSAPDGLPTLVENAPAETTTTTTTTTTATAAPSTAAPTTTTTAPTLPAPTTVATAAANDDEDSGEWLDIWSK